MINKRLEHLNGWETSVFNNTMVIYEQASHGRLQERSVRLPVHIHLAGSSPPPCRHQLHLPFRRQEKRMKYEVFHLFSFITNNEQENHHHNTTRPRRG